MSEKTEGPTDVSVYVSFLIDKERKKGTTYEAIGERWGKYSHAHIHHVHTLKSAVGQKFETALAEALTGGNVHDLRQDAKAWRAKHRDWWPPGYVPPPPKNKDFAWWEDVAKAVLKEKTGIKWAIRAAGDAPQIPEPRESKRFDAVSKAADVFLDLPDERQEEFFKLYGDDPDRPSGKMASAKKLGRRS